MSTNAPNTLVYQFRFFMLAALLLALGTAFPAAALGAYNVTITGANVNGSWSGGNPDTWTPSGDDSTILNTDINTKLNSGTSVIVTTGGGGAQDGDIVVASSISKTAGDDVTLTLKAAENITINTSVSIASVNNKLHTILWSDSDTSDSGYVYLDTSSSISTNGGDITMGGGADPETGYAVGDGTLVDVNYYAGVELVSSTLSSSGGAITLHGKSFDAAGNTGTRYVPGVRISGPSSINSGDGKVSIVGQARGGFEFLKGVLMEDSSTITSSNADSDAISITGTSTVSTDINPKAKVIYGVDLTAKIESQAATGGGIIISGVNIGQTDWEPFAVNLVGNYLSKDGTISVTGNRGTGGGIFKTPMDLNLGRAGSAFFGQKAATGVTSSSADVIFTGDNMLMNAGTRMQSAGSLTIKPRTDATIIGIEGGAGTLSLDADYFSTNFVNGFSGITVGNSAAGAITVGGATTFNDSTTLQGNSTIAIGGAITANENLSLTSAGAITQSAAVGVTGTTTITAGSGNNVTLNTATNNFTGAVSVVSGNDVSLVDADAISLGASTVSGTYAVTATAGGGITNSGVLAITGAATFTAAGGQSIAVANAGNSFSSTVSFVSGGTLANVSVLDITALDLDALTITGDLTATGAGLTQSGGNLIAPGTATFTSTGAANDIVLATAGNNFGTAVVTSGRDATLTDTGAVVLGAHDIARNLAWTAGGDITQSGALAITGTTGITAGVGNNVTFDNAANDFTGAVSVVSGNDVSLRDANAMDLGVSTVSGNLTLQTAGALTQSGALAITGTTGITAGVGNNVTFDNAANDFTGAVSVVSGNDVTINDTDALTITDVTNTLGGKLDLTAGGSGITINDTAITTTTTQDYNSAVILGANLVLTTTNSNINFDSTVNGTVSNAQSLTVNGGAGGTSTFSNHIGGTTPLATLTLTNGNLATTGKNITAGAITVNGGTFNSASAAGTWDLSGGVTIASGATLNATSGTFAVGGNWSNSGTFASGSNTVTFDGAGTSEITGSTSFYNFTCTTAGKTLTFTDGTTQTIGNTLTLTGASGNLITLQGSGTAGWNITDSGTESVSYVDVSYSTATNLITAASSKDSGDNINWVFSGTTVTWDGSTDTDWDTAANWDLGYVPNDTDNVVIANVANDPVLGSAATTNNLTINTGAVLTLNGQNLTVTGTYSNSGTLQLNGNETTVSLTNDSDSGLTKFVVSTGTITIKDLSPYYNVEFDSNASGAGDAVFTLPAAIDVNNNLALTDGALDVSASNYQITVGGSWQNPNNKTFEKRSGTVTFDGVNQSLGAGTFYNLTTSGTGTKTLNGTVTVENTLTTGTDTTFALGSNTLNIGSANTGTGSWTNNATFTKGTGTVNYAETGNQDILTLDYHAVTLSGSGTKTFSSTTTATGGVTVDSSLTVSGSTTTASETIVSGGDSAIVFTLTTAADVGIQNMTIKEGSGTGAGIFIAADSSVDTLDVTNVIFTESSAAAGSGIASLDADTTITMTNSSVKDNDAGCGIFINKTTLNLLKSTVSGNSDTNGGGGILVEGGTLNITNSTISKNTSDDVGGGIGIFGSDGGATVTINSSTIANNHSDNDEVTGSKKGGGIFLAASSNLTVKNTIIASNIIGNGSSTTGDDYYWETGTLTDNGYNIVEVQSGDSTGAGKTFTAATDITGQQANLFGTGVTTRALADNGGPTQTLLLGSGSVAIDTIPYSAGTRPFNGSPDLDQRGYYRAFNTSRDTGAYESGAATPANGDYISTTTGDWSAVGTWDTYNSTTGIWGDPATEPTSSNNVVVAANDTVTVDGTDTVNAQTVSQGGTLAVEGNSLTASGAADIDGTLSISTGTTTVTGSSDIDGTLSITDTGTYDANGTFDAGGGAVTFNDAGNLKIASTVTSLGTLTAGSGTVTYDGTSGQAIAETNTFYNLTVDNSGGVTVNADATVNNTLALTNGLVTLGNNDLTLGATATVSGTPSASKMIVTNGTGVLKKVFSATGSFIFPVGDNTGTAEYSPATLDFTSGTFNSAWTAVKVSNSKQPDNTSTTDYLNRYWTVTQSGISSFSCDTTFNYLAADVAGTEADIYGGQYKDSAWTVLNAVDTANNRFQATISSFSDFTGVEASTPSTQASSIGFSSVAQTQMAVSWTRGNGDKVLVVAHQGSAVDSNPVDGTGYTANAVFGSGTEIGTGNYVVYKGTGTSVTVTGLTAATAYHFRAYEFNDGGVEELYITGTATSNPNNQTTLPNAPSAPTATAATSITQTGFTANWNAASGATGYRLDVATNTGFTSYVSGYQNKDVGNVITSSVTGLTGGTTYYYRVRAVNTGGTGANSNTITATTLTLPTKVALTGPSSVNAGAVSTAFTLTSQDADGNAANVTADTKFDLSSNSSGTKVFYSNSTGTAVITQVTISSGSSTATFYYKDSNSGTPTLMAAWNSGGTDLGSDTLQITVSLVATTLATSTSIPLSFKDFKVTVTEIKMDNGTSWVTLFSGTAQLDLVNGGTFPGISDVSLPAGTYSQIKVTFRNSLPVTGQMAYGGTTYYTTAATFGGASNVASDPATASGSQTVFTFKIDDWGALNADVVKTFDITPAITVDAETDYQPTLRFSISTTFLLKGTAGTGSTYYLTVSEPTVSLVQP
jgi:trimeric autotransporter adhesin